MALSQGDHLGRYEILGPIGAGGMGEVWRARDTELDREVAVKVLPESFADDSVRLERFQREAKALAALSHPNLLDIYDVGSADGLHYAVTELLKGDTLRERIAPTGLPWQKVTEIGGAVADGLAATHGRGIVHRDLKPENLFLTADGRVKILDFGLAAVHEEASPDARTATITEAGTVMGTPGYMSPEQVKGQQADARSDIFALGCVLYEMVSGHRAFGGDTGAEVIASILKEEPPQLSSSGAAVPVDLERAVHRCLEKRPEARFQSAADLAYSLKSVGMSGVSPAMATPSGVTVEQERRRPLWLVAVAAVLVLIAAAIAWQALSPLGDQAPVEIASTLDSNRIAVVPFVNRTGDASLDGLASMTADRLTQGLADLTEIDVAPGSVVAAASAGVDPALVVGEVATSTDSGLVLAGVWDAVGDGLELQATLEDAQRGAVIRAFDPIAATRDAPQEAIATLRDWAQMAVQDHLHDILAWGAGDEFPDYEAYRIYRGYFESMDSGGQYEIFKAVVTDPDFIRPRLHVGSLWGPALFGQQKTTMESFYDPAREMPLDPSQQRIVGMLNRRREGRWEDAYRIAREELDRHPADSWRRLLVAYYAGDANRPLATIEAYEAIDWDPLVPGMIRTAVLQKAADALHRLGRYEEELAVIREAMASGPVSNFGHPLEWYELRALVGLGRLGEVDQRIDEMLTNPVEEYRDPFTMVMASEELRVHGHPAAATAMAERSLDWWEVHPDVPRRLDYTAALTLLGRYDDVLEVVEAMATEFPNSQPVLLKTAECLARMGDRERALEIEARLTVLGRAGLHSIRGIGELGLVEYRSAEIAALLGDADRAVSLLQEAITAGFCDYLHIHRNSAFEPLWDNPEFQEIVRPKG